LVALRRLLSAIPVLFIVSLISFGLMRLIPGDPAAAIAGTSATPAQIEQLRRDLGLDEPVILQLLHYYQGLLRGDFGKSLLLGKGVLAATMERLPVTIGLSLYALVLTLLIGVASGIIAALRQNTWVDQVAMMIAMLGISIPGFFLGLLMIIFFAVQLGWLPSGGYVPFSQDPIGWLRSTTMPAISLALLQAGLLARITRSGMLEVLRQDYVRTARAKGLPDCDRRWHHHFTFAVRRGSDGSAILPARYGTIADTSCAEPRLPHGAGGAFAGHNLPRAGEYPGGCPLCPD
jgi:peptide/nickel transport system permease protein